MRPQPAFAWMVTMASVMALGLGLAHAAGGDVRAMHPVAAAACPAPADLRALHLYGLWRAEFDDGERSSVLLERHPEHTDSLRGAVNRQGVQSRLTGDVDDGELVLDESDDGQRISAVWVAQASPADCGREFRGERRSGSVVRRFVLRRVPGWN